MSTFVPNSHYLKMSVNNNMYNNRLSESKLRFKHAQEMPFSACTDYQVYRECSTQIGNIFENNIN